MTALAFRTPLRSRYWAWRLATAPAPHQRDPYLAALCNAGPGARWGTSALLANQDPDLRQYGVLVLQHVKTAWARQRLLRCLADPDANVRHLAALGLAIHKDDLVVPTLERIYHTGDAAAASTACLAFEHLGTPAAINALQRLTAQPAEPDRRAALIDALAGIAAAECVPALIDLLSDQRACDAPPLSDQAARRALRALQSQGFPVPASLQPTTTPVPRTIAERAAAALTQITGLRPPFSSDASATERAEAERQWSDWYLAHRARQ